MGIKLDKQNVDKNLSSLFFVSNFVLGGISSVPVGLIFIGQKVRPSGQISVTTFSEKTMCIGSNFNVLRQVENAKRTFISQLGLQLCAFTVPWTVEYRTLQKNNSFWKKICATKVSILLPPPAFSFFVWMTWRKFPIFGKIMLLQISGYYSKLPRKAKNERYFCAK